MLRIYELLSWHYAAWNWVNSVMERQTIVLLFIVKLYIWKLITQPSVWTKESVGQKTRLRSANSGLCFFFWITLYSRLQVQGTLWNTSRYSYLDISVLQNWTKKNRKTTFHKWICNLTPEVRAILIILWKRGEIAPTEQFLLFSTIFCYQLLDI